jgi:ankyrin repeat protein
MIKDSAYSTYGFQESDAHAFIAESCIAYIFYYSSCPMRSNTTSDLEYFPLLFYACRYWFEHVRLAGEEQERLVSLVIKLLTSWEVYLSALRIYNPLYPEKPFPCKIHTLASTLGWAAALGLEFLVKQLLQENISEINAIQDIRYFTPEHVYSSRPSDEPSTEYCCEREGRDKMRMTLFANPIRGTALMKAVAHNHENVVRLLIKNGADLHITLYGYAMDINSALSIACDKGHENMVTILLENGANPNKICGRFSTLTSVLHREGFNICRILLDNGAHSDESDSTQESLLMRAASNRQPDICKLLLDHQADINWRMDGEPEEACDALSIASRCGNVELVELFLSRMAHIRPEALLWSLCCSPDFCEDASKNKKVCELLIRHGADLNPDPEDRDTPLAMALHNEWYDIAELMLSKGALVDPNDPSYLTAGNILVAATGSLDMTRRILDMGVDANAQVAPVELFGDESIGDQQYFSSALQAAAFHYNDEVVGLLLKRNADPRIKGPPYGSALFAVVGRIMWDHCASYDELVKAQRTCEMLLAKGASWDRTYGPDNQELMNDCEAGRLALAAWQDAAVPKNIKSVFLKGTSLFLNFD